MILARASESKREQLQKSKSESKIQGQSQSKHARVRKSKRAGTCQCMYDIWDVECLVQLFRFQCDSDKSWPRVMST